MKSLLKIAVAEPSLIIRSGILSVLRRLSSLNIEMIEITDVAQLSSTLSWRKPDMLIINPLIPGAVSLQQIKKECDGLKCIALQYTLADVSTLKGYDEIITIYDTAETIREKIEKLHNTAVQEATHEPLTEREKEIIIGVVKGWTNKQIAEKLCLSAHTVITHRRNIAAKLQIHSAAGLTIYAIVNRFVDLNDVKGSIHRKDEGNG